VTFLDTLWEMFGKVLNASAARLAAKDKLH
jgi:hypothetical protein